MILLERDNILEILRQRLLDAREGRGCLVLIGGEAGVGKTSLLRHFFESARISAPILLGQCDALSTPRPLGPLFDVASKDPALSQLLAENSPRDLLFREVLARLRAAKNSLVLAIEDAHWADEATLDLLRFLGRRIADTRSIVIVTYRDDEIGPRHPFRRLLGDLAVVPSVERVPVRPLTLEAVTFLAMGSGVDPGALHARTAGNPFFVNSVLASGGAMPPTVQDAVLARASRLPPHAWRMLESAAVIGSAIEPGLLDAVATPTSEDLEACVQNGILEYRESHLVFRHELAREAILSAIAPSRRMTLHASVLCALKTLPENQQDPALLAHHAEEAKDHVEVLRHAPEAGRRATALRAHREAANQYERALRFGGVLSRAEVAELLEARAFACYMTAQIDQAAVARKDALAIWVELQDTCKEGENRCHLATLLWAQAKIEDAEREAEAAVALTDQPDAGPELAMAYGTLARLRGPTSIDNEAILLGEQAIALAERFGATETLIDALITVGEARLARGELKAGQLQLDLGMRLSIEAGLDELTARAYISFGFGFATCGQFDIAIEHYERGIRYCADRDLDLPLFHLTALLAQCQARLGDWDNALAHANSVLNAIEVAPASRFTALLVAGQVLVRRDEPGGRKLLDEALPIAMASGCIHFLGPLHAARAEACFLSGNVAEAKSEACAAFDLSKARGDHRYVNELAYWLWKCGELDVAPDSTEEPFAIQIAGNWASAAAAWDERGFPYEGARARAESDDQTALHVALTHFDQLGAKRDAAAVRRRLRQLGARVVPRGARRSTRSNAALLTPREVEVVTLLSENYGNQKIADHLFLSTRTIENHVAAIFTKLGATNRAEAITRAKQLGIIPQTE